MWHRLPSGNYAELCYQLVIMLYYAFCVNYANYAKASDAQPKAGPGGLWCSSSLGGDIGSPRFTGSIAKGTGSARDTMHELVFAGSREFISDAQGPRPSCLHVDRRRSERWLCRTIHGDGRLLTTTRSPNKTIEGQRIRSRPMISPIAQAKAVLAGKHAKHDFARHAFRHQV